MARMKIRITEDELETMALEIFRGIGYEIIYGPDIACDGRKPERKSYQDTILEERLKFALRSLNPSVPKVAIEDALRKIHKVTSPDVIINNRSFKKIY